MQCIIMTYVENKTDNECAKIFIDKFLKNVNRSLFHYTSEEAANSIYKSKEIWLTHYKYFNDNKEFFIGFDLIIHFLELECNRNDKFNKYYQNFLEFLKKERSSFAELRNNHIQMHIMCFCRRKTNFYLKKNYKKGQKLNLVEFTFSNEDIGIKPAFVEVIYSKRKLLKLARNMFYRYADYYFKNASNYEFDKESFFVSLLRDVFLLAISFKHHKYSAEEEVRCISFPIANEVKIHKHKITKSKIVIHKEL